MTHERTDSYLLWTKSISSGKIFVFLICKKVYIFSEK